MGQCPTPASAWASSAPSPGSAASNMCGRRSPSPERSTEFTRNLSLLHHAHNPVTCHRSSQVLQCVAAQCAAERREYLPIERLQEFSDDIQTRDCQQVASACVVRGEEQHHQ